MNNCIHCDETTHNKNGVCNDCKYFHSLIIKFAIILFLLIACLTIKFVIL